MSDTLDRDFTNNVGLQAMRNAWRDGWSHFDQDRYGAYPVTDAVAEAEAHIGIYDRLNPPQPSGCVDEPPRDGMGALRKICEVCREPSRNNPCDACYQMMREAQDPNWGFGLSTKFCIVCGVGDADAQGKLCATCRALLDGRTGV